MSNPDAIKRAQVAEKIISDPLFVEAWEGVRARLIEHMLAPTTTEAGSLKAKMAIGLLNDMRQHFTRVMVDGKVALDQLKTDEQRRKWYQRAA